MDKFVIDPRNRDLIEWSPVTRTFHTDASTLEAHGFRFTHLFGRSTIWIRSHKFKCDILFTHRRNIFDEEGSSIARVFEAHTSDWAVDQYGEEIIKATEGIKLIIYND